VIPSETYPGILSRLSPEDRERRRAENRAVLAKRGGLGHQEPARATETAPGGASGSWLGFYLSPKGGCTLVRRFDCGREAEAWKGREEALAREFSLPWRVEIREVR
jgi:hypothetical protein